MDLNLVSLNVFISLTFGSNPQAVITDVRNLKTQQLQAITLEFNYSEQTFVLPPEHPRDTAVVRIFTPAQEIPFAGHPNVGARRCPDPRRRGIRQTDRRVVRFREQLGVVEIETLHEVGLAVGARRVDVTVTIDQGVEMGRPRRIDVGVRLMGVWG